MNHLKQAWWDLNEKTEHYRFRSKLLQLKLRNRFLTRSVIGNAPVAVSLTSYGTRIDSVYLTIESIAVGSVRPRRITLWIDEPSKLQNLPASLLRLQSRGLQIEHAPNFGPHTKYFPYIQKYTNDDLPLVTADDDVIYPPEWLEELLHAHERTPTQIHCFRARQMLLDRHGIRPYVEWPLCAETSASLTNFFTAVSGVIYPRQFLTFVRQRGSAFMQVCPKADDIWLNLMALRADVRVVQLRRTATDFPEIPGSQAVALWRTNQFNGANDLQIRATYSQADFERLRADCGPEGH